MSATALADTVGVSRQSITYYESGVSTPQPEVLTAISGVLSMPERYFLSEFDPVEAPAIHFRALKKTPKKARQSARIKTTWIARLTRHVEKYVDLPRVFVPGLEAVDPRTLSNSDVDQIAEEVRVKWGLGDGPISDLCLLMENNGIVVSRFPLSHEAISGFSLWEAHSNRPFVTVNNRRSSSSRSRFDAAHELGHMVMHRGITERDQRDRGLYDLMEAQAHRFASSFLMPTSSFLRDFSYPSLSAFEALKSKWKTSIKAMIYKSKHIGLLDSSMERQLYIEYNSAYPVTEPYEDEIEPEEPRLLRRSVHLLVGEGLLSQEKLSQEIAVSSSEISQLASIDWAEVGKPRHRLRSGLDLAPERSTRSRHNDLG